MSEDAGGPEGFAIASAYVQVNPDAADFEGELESQIGGIDYVVKIPVVPDTGDFAGEVDAAVAESKAAVQVPVVPDTEGFQLLIDNAVAEAKDSVTIPVVPDAAGFAEKVDEAVAEGEKPVTVPVVPDTAGFAEKVDAETAVAAEASGATFADKFAATAAAAPLFPASAAERDAETAAEDAGTGFAARFSSLLSGLPLLAGIIPGVTAEGEEAGEVAGAGLMSKLKGVISGDMPVMEALLGAAFVAATADMAVHFQAAMELIHTQAGVAQSAIASLSGGVLSLAGQVGESPDSLAASLYHVESSFQSVGITGQKAMSLLQVASEGARTGGADLVDVTNALDATIASGVGGVKNYSQAMGALNAIVGAGDMTMQDLANAMGSGLMANAKLYGQSIQQVGAALATLGDNNIRGAKAATDLRMAWQALLDPLSTAGPMLNSIGLSASSLGDTLKHSGMTDAIQEFVQHLEASKVPVSDWGTYVTDIFGKKAGSGIGVLTDQLARMQSKLPDIQKGADDFGNAWASTEATTSQKLKELESGFEALMIKIGDGLLPSLNAFMGMLTRNLPTLEHFGTTVAHLVAPVVTSFFTGLTAILKEAFGPLRDLTLGLGAWLAMEVLVAAMNPFGWVVLGIAALVTLVGAVIKYHKEIFDTITNTWNAITHFFASIADPLFRPVEKAFDDFKTFITNGFDKWWDSHGKQIQKVWSDAWTVMKTVFTTFWHSLVDLVTTYWDAVMDVLKPGLDLLNILFKVTWDEITAIFKTAWDVMSAYVKIVVATIEAVIKTEWDIIVGIFNVFLDLITGNWSKAWTDLKTMLEQVWNNIKDYFGTVWNDIYHLAVQIINNLKSFLTSSWDDVKSGVTSAFNDVRNTIKTIWDGILSDIEGVVNKIKSVISSVAGAPGKVLSSIGSAIGLAGGGVLAGYAPGHDSINARLSPGEAVLVPEAVRAIGPDRINAINAHYSAGRRGYSDGGLVPGYSTGGISPYAAGQAAGQMYSNMASLNQAAAGGGNVININFFGPQMPTPEQEQALLMKVSAAIGIA